MQKQTVIYIILTVWFVTVINGVSAQRQGNVWVFGDHAGLDFNSGTPSAFRTSIRALTGAASVSDEYGNLMFYTDGDTIYNKHGVTMSNGIGLTAPIPASGGKSTEGVLQAVTISYIPDNPGRYYVFSLGHNGRNDPFYGLPYSDLYYSIVDMSLNNGMGDVVPGSKRIRIGTDLAEKMTLAPGADCNVWLVVRSAVSNEYYSYNISDTGIAGQRVVSNTGNVPVIENYIFGAIEFSNSGKVMVAGVGNAGTRALELYDFNRFNGLLGNARTIDSFSSNYAGWYDHLAFSPNDTFLYASNPYQLTPGGMGIFQFNISLSGSAAISGSKTAIYISSHQQYQIKTGPDGRIYFGNNTTRDSIHVIMYPDSPALACRPVFNAVRLTPGTQVLNAFPATVIYPPVPDTLYEVTEVMSCQGVAGEMLYTDPEGTDILWNNGSRDPIRTVYRSGNYEVVFRKKCTIYKKVFQVLFLSFPQVKSPIYFCTGDQSRLSAIPLPGDQREWEYTWTDEQGNILRHHKGNAGDAFSGLPAGHYRVRLTNGNACDTTVGIEIVENEGPDAKWLLEREVVCTGDPVLLKTDIKEVASTWLLPRGTTIEKASTEVVFNEPGAYDITLILENLYNCRDSQIQTVTVKKLELSLTANPEYPDQGTMVLLSTTGDDPYEIDMWTPAHLFDDQQALTQEVIVKMATDFMIAGTSLYGCKDTAALSVRVKTLVQMPDAFSPNNDGVNDTYKPVVTHGKAHVDFMRIYDRWGRIVWSRSGNTAALGWDGTYSGMPAETGTYFYLLEASRENEKIMLKGDFLLLR